LKESPVFGNEAGRNHVILLFNKYLSQINGVPGYLGRVSDEQGFRPCPSLGADHQTNEFSGNKMTSGI
jgi:hypothetical protein